MWVLYCGSRALPNFAQLGTRAELEPPVSAWVAAQPWGPTFEWAFVFNAHRAGSEARQWFDQQIRWSQERIADLGGEGDAQYFDLINPFSNRWLDGGQDHDNGLDAISVIRWCGYQALALAAQHPDVYLFTKADEHWPDEKVWAQGEFWTLTHNPSVHNIWRVDPRSGACAPKALL